MPEIHEYYCVKCGAKVQETDTYCPKCKAFLASDGAVKIKKIQVSETKLKVIDEIYKNNFKVFLELTPKEKERFKEHRINSRFPVWACIILHFLTIGLFTLIYFGIKHGKLPKVHGDDPTTGQAIGFMFIPLFNIYWYFFYWLRLTSRINFQYKLRGKEPSISRTFILITLILRFIPYLNLIQLLILMPVVIGIVQSASNGLVDMK